MLHELYGPVDVLHADHEVAKVKLLDGTITFVFVEHLLPLSAHDWDAELVGMLENNSF